METIQERMPMVASEEMKALLAIPFLVARHSFRITMELRSDLKDFVRALSEGLEKINTYISHHAISVTKYAVRVAHRLIFMKAKVKEIENNNVDHEVRKKAPQQQQ